MRATDGTRQSNDQGDDRTLRLTVSEAAEALNISQEAVRGRIKRRTLRTEKELDGGVRVLLDADRTQPTGGKTDAQAGDQSERIAELHDQVLYLRGQLEEERESRRRADTIIAQLSQTAAEQARTIRAIEPPQDAADDPEGVEVHDADAGPQTTSEHGQVSDQAERPGFWKRLFS